MGLSYTIIPTSELSLEMAEKGDTFLKHFKSIGSYYYPDDWRLNLKSKYPTLQEIYKSFELDK